MSNVFGLSSQNNVTNQEDDDDSTKKIVKFPLPESASEDPNNATQSTSIQLPSDISNPKMKIWVPKDKDKGGATLGVKKLGDRNKTAPVLQVDYNPDFDSDIRTARSENMISNRPKGSMFGDIMNFFRAKKASVAPEVGHISIESGQSQPVPEPEPQFTAGRRRMAAFGIDQDCDLSQIQENDDNDPEISENQSINAIESINTLQQSIQKWKKKKTSERQMMLDSIAVDAQHQACIDDTAKRAQTEVPIPLQLEVRKEAYEIVKKTRQIYSSILGNRNDLTKDAIKREREIAQSIFGEKA